MIPSPEQHSAALDAAVESLDPTVWGELHPDAPRQIIGDAIAIYLAHLSALPERADRTVEMVARGMWEVALGFIEISEAEAISVSGDDWNQYLPLAERLVAEHCAPPAGESP